MRIKKVLIKIIPEEETELHLPELKIKVQVDNEQEYTMSKTAPPNDFVTYFDQIMDMAKGIIKQHYLQK